MKIGRLGAYVRDGMSVEILTDESCTRDELLERGREAFKLEKTLRGQVLALFTLSGSAIVDEKWSLCGYAKRMKKSEIKLGIGYISVSSKFSHLNINSKMCVASTNTRF